jgi:hypothetical protein
VVSSIRVPMGVGLVKSNGGADHGLPFAGGQLGFVGGQEPVGAQGEYVAEDVAFHAAQVEVGMVGQVHDGGLIGGGPVVNTQGVVALQRVGYFHRQRARVAFFAVGGRVGQPEGRCGAVEGRGRPELFVEAHAATVDVVAAAVGGELVGLAVQREGAAGNAVGVPANDRAQRRGALQVIGKDR